MSFLEWGAAGAPALHFGHATGFNARTYAPLLTPLADRFHLIASDARGHGLSTLPPTHARHWGIFRDDLLRLLDALGEQRWILVGHSLGASVSILAAVAASERVRGLVLVEPVLVPRSWALLHWLRWASFRQPGPSLAARAAKRRSVFPSREEAYASYCGRGAFRTWPDEFLHAYLDGGLLPPGNGTEVRLACTPAWEAASFRATPLGLSHLARRVHCPVTLLYAEDSTPPESECRAFARRHGNTRLVKVPDTTHFLPMERPDIVRDEILRLAVQL